MTVIATLTGKKGDTARCWGGADAICGIRGAGCEGPKIRTLFGREQYIARDPLFVYNTDQKTRIFYQTNLAIRFHKELEIGIQNKIPWVF